MNRAVSEVIGFILLTALVITGVSVVVLIGGDDFDRTTDNIEKENVLQGFNSVNSIAHTDSLNERSVDMGTEGYSGQLSESEGSTVTFTERDKSTGDTSELESFTMETIEYREDDYTIMYEGSAVWLVEDGDYVERASPRLSVSENSMNFNIESGERFSVSGDTVTISPSQGDVIFDGISTQESEYLIEVEGESYQVWADHFESESQNNENVSYTVDPDENKTTLHIEGPTTTTTTDDSGPESLDPDTVVDEFESSEDVDSSVPTFFDDYDPFGVCTTEVTVSHSDDPECKEDYFRHGAGISGEEDSNDTTLMLTSVVPQGYDGGDILFEGDVTYETGNDVGQSTYEQSTPIFLDNGDINIVYDGNVEEMGPPEDDAMYYNGFDIHNYSTNSNTARVYVNGHHKLVDATTGAESSPEQLQIIVPEGGSIEIEGDSELHADVYFADSEASVSSGDCSESTICVGNGATYTGSTNGSIDSHSQATVDEQSSTFEPESDETFESSSTEEETNGGVLYIYGTINK